MCEFEYIFLQLYFSLARVRGKVKLYLDKVNLTKIDKDITNFIS